MYINIQRTEIKSRKSKPKAKTNALSKKVKQNIESLNEYSSSNALKNSLMNKLKSLYKNRDITNIKTATSAIHLLDTNIKSDLNIFSKTFSTIMKQTENKTEKAQAKIKQQQ